jgi:hypothetical protein
MNKHWTKCVSVTTGGKPHFWVARDKPKGFLLCWVIWCRRKKTWTVERADGVVLTEAASEQDAKDWVDRDGLSPMMHAAREAMAGMSENQLLAMRCGDFYEFLFEQAKVVSAILKLALCKRNNVFMCGVVFHAAHDYFKRLEEAGYTVVVKEDWK